MLNKELYFYYRKSKKGKMWYLSHFYNDSQIVKIRIYVKGEAKENSKEDRDAEWGFLPFQMMYLG